jgi:hypothetical protein
VFVPDLLIQLSLVFKGNARNLPNNRASSLDPASIRLSVKPCQRQTLAYYKNLYITKKSFITLAQGGVTSVKGSRIKGNVGVNFHQKKINNFSQWAAKNGATKLSLTIFSTKRSKTFDVYYRRMRCES